MLRGKQQSFPLCTDEAVQNDAKLRLAGVPVAVKSAFSTARVPTTWGTPVHGDQLLPEDADLVAALASAGAVIIGKTALTEYCSGAAPATLNPHDPTRSPGGSSSGSAAAVAAGMVPVALGSQTMGSIIRPASYCGVYGFKPSFGLVSRGGLQRVSEELDTVGWFTNIPQDALLLLEAAIDYQIHQSAAVGVPPIDERARPADTRPDEVHMQQHLCHFTTNDAPHEIASHPELALKSDHTWPFLCSPPVTADVRGSQLDTQSCGRGHVSQPLLHARVARIHCGRCDSEASPDALAALDSAEQALARMGATVTHVPLPRDIQGYFEATQVSQSLHQHATFPCHGGAPVCLGLL